VNDRGPFKDGRIIDLSYTAASKLDILRDGTAFVEVRALTPEQRVNAPAPSPPPGALYVQAGAFSSEANATKLLTQLRAQGLEPGFVREDTVNGQTFFRVRLGPVANVRAFDALLARLKALGVADARLALD
jgi:rare lipoprotein A